MTDVLENASNWLENQRRRHAAHEVTFVRGGRPIVVLATIGKTTFEVDDGYGVLIRHESRDYLITAEDLILDDTPVIPQRGDRIQETQGLQTFVYEVTAPGKEPIWNYSDHFRKTLRIHTTQIGTS